ncbi:MAG: hypothetical protein JM58_05110 [Peptococcaceae bacterium BICA1-8]|nr:MAG: hypothetical protein JM58_05110 [Peptococcaceae bacterium BICA1-8]
MNDNQKACPHLSRRDFLKSSAFLGSTAFLSTTLANAEKSYANAVKSEEGIYPLMQPENILYSACLQCTVACSIKVKLIDGVAVKIDGNPYSAMTLAKNIPYDIKPQDAVTLDGKLCPKGQAGIQHAYDPYRLRRVLKRKGPRGSNQWEVIPFDQAVNEIVQGGKLFAHIGEDREISGLKEIITLKDAAIAKAMKEDVDKIRKKQMTVAEFQEKNREHLNYLIDPNHPDKGAKNNQFLYQVGRIHGARKEFTERWVKDAMGSINWIEKTTLCGQTSNKSWAFSTMGYKDGKWSGGGHAKPRPDHWNNEFLLVFGTIIFEACYGPVQESEPITEGLSNGRLKMAVADPRMTKVASKAWKWLPLKPGTDGALALGMIRWMLENERYDKKYLANATRAAADLDGELGYSNAAYLVKIVEGNRGEKHLRASEIGIGTENQFVVLQNGEPIAVTPEDKVNPIEGDLFVDTEIEGIKVKSPLQLVKEEAFAKSLDQWSEITGIDAKDIAEVAKEFTSYGKKAGVEFYRGSIKHTNGWHNAHALIILNFLVGNPDWKGGLSKPGGAWKYIGGNSGQPYDLKKLHPGKVSGFGIPLTREGWNYEESTLFEGYPAKRPWYPFSANVAQETWASNADEYPYGIKAALISSHNPMYSIPGGQAQLKTLLDPVKVPLLICCDIIVGDSSQYADYIFPDITYLERWATPGAGHHVRVKVSQIRQPVIDPLTETVEVFGEKMPASLEALMMAIAERLNLSGFGKDAFGSGMDLVRMEDYYLKTIANIVSDKGLNMPKDADEDELKLFRESRRHLSPAIYEEEKWKKALKPEEWRKVVYALNRGGRFEPHDEAYAGDTIKKRLGGMSRLYLEEVANTRHAVSGKYFSGYPIYQTILDSMGKEVNDKGEFSLITFKEVWGTQSRTISNYWSQVSVMPENGVVINSIDAQKLGVKDGDLVQVKSSSNPEGIHLLDLNKTRPIIGKVKIVEGIRPGVVGISTHFGHWGYGANDIEVDGKNIKGDARRGTGIHPGPLFRLDDNLRGTPLSEPIGGSVSFFDTQVTIIPV